MKSLTAEKLSGWKCVLQEEVKGNMYKEQPSNDGGLAVMYTFKGSDISKATNGKVCIYVCMYVRRVLFPTASWPQGRWCCSSPHTAPYAGCAVGAQDSTLPSEWCASV